MLGNGCKNYSNSNFNFERYEIIDHETICYQECLKKDDHSTSYFYTDKDNKTLEFKRANLNKEVLLNCRDLCQVSECEQIHYVPTVKKKVNSIV